MPVVHMSSSGDRTWGKVLLAALLLSRTITFTTACDTGPQPGELGGKCDDNGCNTYCNDGLTCDNASNTCVGNPSYTQPPPESCTTLLYGSSECEPGYLRTCIESPVPDPAWNGACMPGAHDDAGDTIFCCDTSKPMCLPVGSSCPDPAQGYYCHDLSAPPIPDASIQCALDFSNDAGSAYCCASGDVCFAAPPDEALDDCAPEDREYFCAGAATPDAGGCRAVIAPDGGTQATQARAYCCPGAADAGTAGDADAD